MILPPFFGATPKYDVEDVKKAIISYLSQDTMTFSQPASDIKLTYLSADTMSFSTPAKDASVTYIAIDAVSTAIGSDNVRHTFNVVDILTFDPPPEPPNATFFTFELPEDSQIYLGWNTPYANRDPIIHYSLEYAQVVQVQSDPANYSYTVFSEILDNQDTVTSLTNNQDYIFRIAAANSIGTGVYGYSNILTPQDPSHDTCDIVLLLQPNSTSDINAATLDLSCRDKDVEDIATVDMSSTAAFGAGSLYFDGTLETSPSPSTYPHLRVDHDHDNTGDDWSLSDDFNIELWIMPDSASASSNQTLASYYWQNDPDDPNAEWYSRYWKLYRYQNSIKFKMYNELYDSNWNDLSSQIELSANDLSISTSVFTHIAVSRFNDYIRLYINGILYDRQYFAYNLSINYDNNPYFVIAANQTDSYLSSDTFNIGRGAVTEPYIGYIDDFMLSKSARYAKEFNPAQYTTPLTCTDCGYTAAASSNKVSDVFIP